MKTIDKDKDPISLVAEQMNELRKELREKIWMSLSSGSLSTVSPRRRK